MLHWFEFGYVFFVLFFRSVDKILSPFFRLKKYPIFFGYPPNVLELSHLRILAFTYYRLLTALSFFPQYFLPSLTSLRELRDDIWRLSANLLVWFFVAVKMQIMLTSLRVKITNFNTFIHFALLKLCFWPPNMVKNIFEIIYIFLAGKNHTSNFNRKPKQLWMNMLLNKQFYLIYFSENILFAIVVYFEFGMSNLFLPSFSSLTPLESIDNSF